jgi:hypothetical protein
MISIIDLKGVEEFIFQIVAPHNKAVDSEFLIILKSGKSIVVLCITWPIHIKFLQEGGWCPHGIKQGFFSDNNIPVVSLVSWRKSFFSVNLSFTMVRVVGVEAEVDIFRLE